MRQVVIIEDEADVGQLLAHRFAREGFRVATATEGRTGLHAVHIHHPDLVTLDLLLPLKNGWEVCRSLLENSFVCNATVTSMGDTQAGC